MSRNARYDILFEPLRIGPVTAKNRFYRHSSVSWDLMIGRNPLFEPRSNKRNC